MLKRFLSLLLLWSVLCGSLAGYVLLPVYAQGERAGIYSCNLPQPSYGSLRAVGGKEVFGLDHNAAMVLWNTKGLSINYSRDRWEHYFTASLTAESVNGLKLRYAVYFATLKNNPRFLYVFVHRVSDKGIVYDYPCVSFTAERDYLENFITYLRSI